MQKIVVIANGAGYGQESLFNALRLALAMKEQAAEIELKIFLMSDAVTAALPGKSHTKVITCSRCWRSSVPSRRRSACVRPAPMHAGSPTYR
ncbi:Uncharacterized conserved protein involved in intracellular sulfur reduction [Edwardsiella tarda]|nr:Uncharacterized conserved protein involved in intracellular sulfur reduction [Edwardsiella tarda]